MAAAADTHAIPRAAASPPLGRRLTARIHPAHRSAAAATVAAVVPAFLASSLGLLPTLGSTPLAVPVGPLASPALSSLPQTVGPVATGALISVVATAIAAALVYHHARAHALPDRADSATWLFALSPTTVFLLHSPALAVAAALAAGATFAARRGHFGGAGILAAVLALWVPGGILVILPIAITYGGAKGWRGDHFGLALAAPLIPIAVVAGWIALRTFLDGGDAAALAQGLVFSAAPQLPTGSLVALWGTGATARVALLFAAIALLTVLATIRSTPAALVAWCAVAAGLALCVPTPAAMIAAVVILSPVAVAAAHLLGDSPARIRPATGLLAAAALVTHLALASDVIAL